MVFLRDSGSDGSRFPSGFSPPKKRIKTAAVASLPIGSTSSRVNSTVREGDRPQAQRNGTLERGDASQDLHVGGDGDKHGGSPAKRAPSNAEPAESLLHRLAGPSTGKAGLKRDPDEVRKIIYQSSKGGHYYKNEERKDEQLTAQINASLADLAQAIESRRGDLKAEERKADRILLEQEAHRDLSQSIVVIDCDAFYASVEELDDPSLKGKAFGVGEGVLTTASYEARKFGCRSAMPGYIAKKLCPHLIFVKPDFTKYSQASSKVMTVLARYDPNFSPASLDEAYMNITPYLKRTRMTAEEAISQLRAEVKQETGLTVSAGCGPNTMLAKIAADVNKPDGQCIIESTAAACRDFMQDLSVRKIPGIGRVTERWLEALGVVKCHDIYTLRAKLVLAKGESGSTWLFRSYLGIAGNTVEKGKREDRRGVGHETTFSTLWRSSELDNKLREISESLGDDLARLQYSGRTLTLKLKLETYEVLSRSRTFDAVNLATAEQLYRYGKQLLDTEVEARSAAYDAGKQIKGKGRDLRLRLMGLKVSNLRDESDGAAHKISGLHKWTVKKDAAIGRAENAKTVSSKATPIDLTLEEEEEADSHPEQEGLCGLGGVAGQEDDDDDFEEIFLEAAPCPKCRVTLPFADGLYERHVKDCPRKQGSPAIIDLSKSSQTGDDGEAANGTLLHRSVARDLAGKVHLASPKDGKSARGKTSRDAFTQLMQRPDGKKIHKVKAANNAGAGSRTSRRSEGK